MWENKAGGAVRIIDCNTTEAVLESVQPKSVNQELIGMFQAHFLNRVTVIRSGSVAVETVGWRKINMTYS